MEAEVVARAQSERGEVVLRRRDEVLELRVNGVFVMDSAQTDTERLLARDTLRRTTHPRRVLVGGLGLGFTVRELLADARVTQVTVAEIEDALVDWMRRGVLPGQDVLADPRMTLVVADVREVIATAPEQEYDVVLLDVDNGPDFLVYPGNAAVYAEPFLRRCRSVLAPGGILAIWSSTPSADLAAALCTVFDDVDVTGVPVDLQGRAEQYWLLTSKMSS